MGFRFECCDRSATAHGTCGECIEAGRHETAGRSRPGPVSGVARGTSAARGTLTASRPVPPTPPALLPRPALADDLNWLISFARSRAPSSEVRAIVLGSGADTLTITLPTPAGVGPLIRVA